MSTAAAWLDEVLDGGSFRSWDAAPTPPADADYRAALARAGERSGADEAVRTGAGTVAGRGVAVIVSEFGFLGGSIGLATAARIVAAFERAAAEGRPVIAGLASGGTRMQEGAAAFLTMRTIAAAVQRFRLSGLPYLAHLRHPVTGGVYASWASLADDVSAEPGALIGLLGPRVVEGLAAGVPQGVQCAENVHAHGLLDVVVDAAGFRVRAATLLGMLGAAPLG
ncbi:MAG TPA: carboxyl transferase domain-containing protein, partial [Microbacterium sp.]|nr:carboxyl transferase domain-containing protein [Microbacterium sp.]